MKTSGYDVGPAIFNAANRNRWDDYVQRADGATNYHRSGWMEVVRRAFGHDVYPLWAISDGEVVGVLPLVHMKSLLFGNFLTSMPFFNYGGVLANSSEVAEGLVEAAAQVAQSTGAAHVELRQLDSGLSGLPGRNHKVSMRLDLSGGSEALWTGFKAKVRNQIRKAERSGLTADSGGAELLDEFYDVFSRNMRDLGTPVYPKRFFQCVLEEFSDSSRVFVIRHGEKCVAGSVTVWFRGLFEVPWASSIRSYNPMCPNNLLYWTMIRRACDLDCHTFDFGRSTPDKGTFRFKKQWGAAPRSMVWQYLLSEGRDMPDLSPDNPKYRLMVRTWQRLPVGLTKLLGPPIVRNIP